MKIKKKFKINLPLEVKALYRPEKNLLILIGPTKTRSLNPSLRVFIFSNKSKNYLAVSNVPVHRVSKADVKKIQYFQGKLVAEIKNCMVEVQNTFYRKLKLVGVGYRLLSGVPANSNESSTNFTLKLGYSHLIHCKLPQGVQVFCRRFIYPTFFGDTSAELLNQTIAKIRRLRKPEPYKGKGILYLEEKIDIKQGKKA